MAWSHARTLGALQAVATSNSGPAPFHTFRFRLISWLIPEPRFLLYTLHGSLPCSEKLAEASGVPSCVAHNVGPACER